MELEDRDVREQAAFEPLNIAVTAGAGTGKTKLLIDAVLARGLVRNRELPRILMLTFTEKAAGEMRTRLEDLITEVQDPDSPERARWLARVPTGLDERLKKRRDELPRAEIGTIHGFCAHLLRQYPIEAGLDPAFEIDEGERSAEIFDREWGRWLDAELAAKSPHEKEWRRILGRLGLGELRAVAEGLCLHGLPDEALDPGQTGNRALKKLLDESASQLEALAKLHPGPKNNLQQQLLDTAAFFRSPGPVTDGRFDKEASKAAKGWKEEDFDKAHSAMADALDLASDVASIDEELLRDVLGLLAPFAREFRRTLTREGIVGFDDLLTRVRTLLLSEDFPEVRGEVKAKYDHILVDEFQDTDPVQCEIILLLSEDANSHESDAMKVKLAKDRLFVVGDPKQSIYSFRGADIVAYERLKDVIRRQKGMNPVLRTNFRSHSGILGAVNTLFEKIIRRNGEYQPEYEAISPHEGRTPSLASQKVELLLVDREGGGIKTEEARMAEAEEIASWIAANVGKLQLPGRPMAHRDVAILLRSLTDVHLLLERLRDHGVPYVVEGEKYYYGTQEVIDFVNLLRAIANPLDRIAMAGLLRSPIGAVDDATLLRLVKDDKIDYRRDAAPEVAQLFAALRELHELASQRSVPFLIDEIFRRLPVLELAALSFGREQAVANLLKMRRAAEEFEESGSSTATLRQFLKRVSRSVRELTEEGESALADEALDAVRILSIHKSKGLEFPVVFLPDLHRDPPARDDDPVRYDWPEKTLGIRCGELVSPGGAVLAHVGKRRRREEDRRILYVAMTRARERLVLSGSAGFPGRSYLSMIATALGEAGGALPDGDATVTAAELSIDVRRRIWKESASRRASAADGEKIPAVPWKKIDEAWIGRSKECQAALATVRFTSPSRLQEAPKVMVSDFDEEARAQAADTGTLCHLVMERLDFASPDFSSLVKSCAAELGMKDFAEAEKILVKFGASKGFAELAAAEILARELPFFMPSESGIVQGVIDAVVRFGKVVAVVDYKTDREEHPEKYSAQKKWYVDAVKSLLGLRAADFRLVYLRSGRIVRP